MTREQAMQECVYYVLDTEAQDFYEWLAEQVIEVTPDNWKTLNHIYIYALVAMNYVPDWDQIAQIEELRANQWRVK